MDDVAVDLDETLPTSKERTIGRTDRHHACDRLTVLRDDELVALSTETLEQLETTRLELAHADSPADVGAVPAAST
jgi:hypothetical protein